MVPSLGCASQRRWFYRCRPWRASTAAWRLANANGTPQSRPRRSVALREAARPSMCQCGAPQRCTNPIPPGPQDTSATAPRHGAPAETELVSPLPLSPRRSSLSSLLCAHSSVAHVRSPAAMVLVYGYVCRAPGSWPAARCDAGVQRRISRAISGGQRSRKGNWLETPRTTCNAVGGSKKVPPAYFTPW